MLENGLPFTGSVLRYAGNENDCSSVSKTPFLRYNFSRMSCIILSLCSVSISPDAVEQIKARKYNLLHESKTMRDEEEFIGGHGAGGTGAVKDVGVITQERTRLVVFGVAKIHRTRLLASLSGLKLEAEITALHSSTTWRKKSRPASLECSLTGQVGRAMIVLLEGAQPNQQ